MACCIFNLQSRDYRADSGIFLETICRPTQFQRPNFHIIFGGRSLRRLEGAGIELSSVQLVHKFAATLSNTMIHKQIKNDKKGFGKFGPLAEGRGVSSIALCEFIVPPRSLIKCPPHSLASGEIGFI